MKHAEISINKYNEIILKDISRDTAVDTIVITKDRYGVEMKNVSGKGKEVVIEDGDKVVIEDQDNIEIHNETNNKTRILKKDHGRYHKAVLEVVSHNRYNRKEFVVKENDDKVVVVPVQKLIFDEWLPRLNSPAVL